MMTRTIANLWLDLVALLVIVTLSVTGGIMHYVLPPGTGHSLRLFGLGRHDYGAIHFWLAVAAVALLVLHIVLHWSFVCCVVAKSFGKERLGSRSLLGWGAGFLVVTVLLPTIGLMWAASHVEAAEIAHRGQEETVALAVGSVSSDLQPAEKAALGELVVPLEEPKFMTAQQGTTNKHEETCPKGAAINGRSTFGEAAAGAGLSVDAMSKELRLTVTPDASARLGQLRRQSGLSIHEVRRLVCRKR